VYRWASPNVLDLQTTAKAMAELPDFEVFLASYFTEQLPISHIYVQKTPQGAENAFMAADESYGVWQAYPRNDVATALIKDGRWTKPPSPVDWAIMPKLAAPLLYRQTKDATLTVAIMAPPDDAFAGFTPCEGEKHYSMYFGLFGHTLREGEIAVAHSRLVVLSDTDDAAVVDAYRAYVSGMKKE
jgi:hypothetical protein